MFTPESERCSERDELSLEARRQVFHLALILLWCVPIYYFPLWANLLLFASVLSINLLLVLRNRVLLRIFSVLIEHLERERNIDKPGIQALYANLGIFLSYLLFGKLSLVGVVVLSVGDSFSTLVGKLFGRNRLFFNRKKTWEGTLAFFLVTYGVLSPWLGVREALLVSSFGAFLESLELPVDDNLLIPLAVSGLAYLVWYSM